MPAENLLVSCADEIRLWPFASYSNFPSSPSLTCRPHTGQITGLSLNHNNSVIVTCGVDGLIHLTNINGSSLFTLPSSASLSSSSLSSLYPLSCLSLTSGSRYIMCGGFGQSSEIIVWDLKRQSINRTLTGHTGEVTCISLSVPQSPSLLIASGDSDGKILIHNIESGIPKISLKLNNKNDNTNNNLNDSIRAIQYNPHQINEICSGGSNGIPYLWDLQSQSLISNFHSSHYHDAPITSIQYSLTNSSLLLTTSIDTKILLHDKNSRLPVLTIDCHGGSITSSDWNDDGQIIGIGCLNGSILLYDTRMTGKYLIQRNSAHQTEVKQIKFSHQQQKNLSKIANNSTANNNKTPASVISQNYQQTPATMYNNNDNHHITNNRIIRDDPISATKANSSSLTTTTTGFEPVTPYIPHHRSAAFTTTTINPNNDRNIPSSLKTDSNDPDNHSTPLSSRRSNRNSVTNIINRRSSFPAPAPFTITNNTSSLNNNYQNETESLSPTTRNKSSSYDGNEKYDSENRRKFTSPLSNRRSSHPTSANNSNNERQQ